MVKARVKETDEGIQGEFTVAIYDEMLRSLRDKGWIETDDVIASGIDSGSALEIGPGPGYLGLEWLKKTHNTRLTGLDISPDMVALAGRNAAEYGLSDRATYVQSSGNNIIFDDNSFDAVFTNGSLHEWEDPCGSFDEIYRVLKPGGRFFISDMRRDMPFFVRWFLYLGTKPKGIRPGLISSINASYTPQELRMLVDKSKLSGGKISSNLIGNNLTGVK